MKPLSNFIKHFKIRQLAIIIDDCVEPTRGIITLPASSATPELVNEMLTISKGTFHVAITSNRAQQFQLAEMTRSHTEARFAPRRGIKAFVSVEARTGVSTGISVADRAQTIRTLGATIIDPRSLVQPGHIFPVEARSGGVLVRNTLTDAALDCSRLTSATDAAAYCDCLSNAGELYSATELYQIAEQLDLPVTTISEIVKHRLATETLVTRIAEANLPTTLAGPVKAYTFSSKIYRGEHLALVKGDLSGPEPVLTRVQAESTFSDVFGGTDSTSRHHLQKSLKLIGQAGRGVLLYLRKSEPGELTKEIGGTDAVINPNSAMRQYGIGAQILRDLGISQINLISSKQGIPTGIYDFGLTIANLTPINEIQDAE